MGMLSVRQRETLRVPEKEEAGRRVDTTKHYRHLRETGKERMRQAGKQADMEEQTPRDTIMKER